MEKLEGHHVRLTGLGSLAALPDALVSCITFQLDTRLLCRLACCSKLLRVYAYESPVWMHQALSCHDGPLSYKDNWRQTALHLLLQAATQAQHAAQQATMVAVPTAKQQQLVDSLAAAVAAAASGSPSLLPGFTSEFLYRRWYRSNMRLSTFLPPADEIPRVDYGSLNPQSYYNRYDLPAQPVILTGFMSAEWPEGWQQHWQLDQLAELYCDRVFRASRPLGGKTKMRFRDYVDYMLRQADEEPLYIFDEDFADSAPEMLDWYKAPSVIVQDHTSVLAPSMRPSHRWLVLGPARSGASWHVDPALTSAWNALTSGLKRWALYPPHVTPPGLQQQQQRCQQHLAPLSAPSSSHSSSSWCTVSDCWEGDSSSSWGGSSGSSFKNDEWPGSGLTSLQWFLEVYPTLQPYQRPYEFLQRPGEVISIPGGWWHCILNLEPSVAITENFVSNANLERVVAHMAVGSRAYKQDVLGFYEPELRPWVGAWQQRRQQQHWQQWLEQCQQQQQHQGAEVVNQTSSADQVDGAAPVAAAATIVAATCPHGIRAADHGPLSAVQGKAQHSSAITCSVKQSPLSVELLMADIICHRAAQTVLNNNVAATTAAGYNLPPNMVVCQHCQEPQGDQHQSSCSTEHLWGCILDCVAGRAGYRRSRLIGPWLKRIWQHMQWQAGQQNALNTQANVRQEGQQQQQGASSQEQQPFQASMQRSQQPLPSMQPDEVMRQQQKANPSQLLQHQLAAIAERWLAQSEWQQLLACILRAHGLSGITQGLTYSQPASQQAELCIEQHLGTLVFPEAGAGSLVFEIEDIVVKLFMGEGGLPDALAAGIEARLLLAMQQQQQPAGHPQQGQQDKCYHGRQHAGLCGQLQQFSLYHKQQSVVQATQSIQQGCDCKSSAMQSCHSANAQLMVSQVMVSQAPQSSSSHNRLNCINGAPVLCVPKLLGHGAVNIELNSYTASTTSDIEGADAGQQPYLSIPYLVLSRVQGQGTAEELEPQLNQHHRQQLAAACGRLLATLHSLPLQLPPHQGEYSASSTSSGCSNKDCAVACHSTATAPHNSSDTGDHGSSGGDVATIQQRLHSSLGVEPGVSNDSVINDSNSSSSSIIQQSSQQRHLLQQVLQSCLWRDRHHTIWSSEAGLKLPEHRQLLLPPQKHRSPSCPAGQGLPAAKDVITATLAALAAAQGDTDSLEAKGAVLWWPFVQYLQQRYADVVQYLKTEAAELLAAGTVASEIYEKFSNAAGHSIATQPQQQQQQQQQPQHDSPCGVNCTSRCESLGYTGSTGKVNTGENSIVLGPSNCVGGALPCIGAGEGYLPGWMVEQLDAYVPKDLSVLVGCFLQPSHVPCANCSSSSSSDGRSSSIPSAATDHPKASCTAGQQIGQSGASTSTTDTSCSRPPVWLHADLMSGNLMLQLAAVPQQAIAAAVQLALHGQNDLAHDAVSTFTCFSEANGLGLATGVVQVGDGDYSSSSEPSTSSSTPGFNSAAVLQQVSMLDLADAGNGDPLYEFVAVFVSVLNCNVQLLQVALESYSSCLDVSKFWPARQLATMHPSVSKASSIMHSSSMHSSSSTSAIGNCDGVVLQARNTSGTSSSNSNVRSTEHVNTCSTQMIACASSNSCSVSKAFMVYLLLHEEGAMASVLQHYPHLRCAGSYEAIQNVLFGWMDDWWAEACSQADRKKP